MRARDITAALTAILPDGPPVLLWGAPGIGKSDLVDQAAKNLGWDLIVSHPVVDNPTDAKGFPWLTQDDAGETIAEFVPFGTLRRAVAATKPTAWFLDDLGQAIPAVQGAYMQLVLARRINGHVLPDCVRFVAASNRAEDRAGASKMITPLLNRFCHLDMEVSTEDWHAWALKAGIEPDVRAFINWRPTLLHQFDPKTGEKAFPTPRSWEFVSRHAKACPDSVLLPVVSGDVGQAAAAQYIAFRRVYKNLPDVDALMSNPASEPVPGEEKPDVLYATVGAIVEKAKTCPLPKLDNCGILAGRLPNEYGVLLVRDLMAVRKAEVSNRKLTPNICTYMTANVDMFGA